MVSRSSQPTATASPTTSPIKMTGRESAYYDAQDNAVDNNLVDRNHDSGIFLGDARSNRIASNHIRNNGRAPGMDTTDGIRVDILSFTNTLRDNRLHRNVTHDCHDETMNGNFWINNEGATSMPPRLCRGDDDDTDNEKFERERIPSAGTRTTRGISTVRWVCRSRRPITIGRLHMRPSTPRRCCSCCRKSVSARGVRRCCRSNEVGHEILTISGEQRPACAAHGRVRCT